MNSTEVRDQWAERSGEYSPTYYAYYGPNETSELLRERIAGAVASDAAVLELGCSSGRHLSYLHDHGYDDLHGIEINPDAFDVMADAYPELAADGTFYADAIENVVETFADGRFDVIYSVETLQHLHPDDEWVFDELARITDTLLVTVENEGEGDSYYPTDEDAMNYIHDEFPLYYRNWNDEFTDRGLVEVDSTTTDRDVLRAFRPTEDR